MILIVLSATACQVFAWVLNKDFERLEKLDKKASEFFNKRIASKLEVFTGGRSSHSRNEEYAASVAPQGQ